MKKFINKFYTPNSAGIFAAGAIGMLGIFIFAVDTDNELLGWLSLAPFVTVAGIAILFMLLPQLERYVRYLTHDEVNIDLRGIIKLDGRDMFESWTAYMVLVYGIFGLALILWMLPFSVVLVLGLLYGVSKLTRFVFGVASKLKTHVADPNAHKNAKVK